MPFCLACSRSVLLLTPLASAQETRGSIEGVVKDASGAVLPGVTVEARSRWRGRQHGGQRCRPAPTGFRRSRPATSMSPADLDRVSARRNSRGSSCQLGQILKVDFALSIAGISRSGAGLRRVSAHRREAECGCRQHPDGHHRPHSEGARLHERRHHGAGHQQREPKAGGLHDRRGQRFREPLHGRRPRYDVAADRHVEHVAA